MIRRRPGHQSMQHFHTDRLFALHNPKSNCGTGRTSMTRTLTTAFAASLLCTSMLAGSLSAATAPRTRTESALRCELGIGPAECGKNDGCNGGDGRLEKVEYLGRNAAGDDVYDVQYHHADSTYVISPLGPAGKTRRFWHRRGHPNGLTPSPVVGISPRAVPVLIYTRPENSPPGCMGPDMLPPQY